MFHLLRSWTKEVDFLAFKGRRLSAAIEVKYQQDPPQAAIQALGDIGGGLLLSSTSAYWSPDNNTCVLPTAVFLALL